VDRCTQLTALTALQHDLLTWGERARRDLPWRRTRDPWAVLVSELMLQQTQVPRVLARYEPFVERFPTPAACRAASVGEVVAAWSGLGYNRRAANLHRCAVAVCERHDGRLPDDIDALLALPGIGPTRPERFSSSPTNATSDSSTPTPGGSSRVDWRASR
jgi:A/G-specific adenine glycosylase